MKKIFTIIALMWCCAIQAQRHIGFSDNIASLQVVAGLRWQDMPIIRLGSPERINISFDDLSHQYRRITYSLVHLEADFTESQGLFSSDYVTGFQDGATIDDFAESINTIQNYTHYRLTIPNEYCRPRISGNYRLDIKDDNNDGEVLASAFFMIAEDKANIGIAYTANTDIDIRKTHQQVELKVDYSRLGATNPREQIKGYVIQNGRWDNAVALPTSTGINQQFMEWTHCRDLIFDAGNEYHKFEILDVTRNSLNVENNAWDGNTWHTILWPDYSRPSYVYDETPKGAFYIRNSDNSENDITSEYVTVHFSLQLKSDDFQGTDMENDEGPLPYPLYLNGMWTNDSFSDRYLMTYDPSTKAYRAQIPLKYGYYSYQYLMLRDDGTTLIPPTEGSFYQTANKYTALIYYRGINDRTDRLVGVANN